MATERGRQLVLAGLAIVLIVVLVKVWPGGSAPPPAESNRPGSSSAPRSQPGAAEPGAPVVHLQTLNDERPRPDSIERNLFRFGTKAAAAPPPSAGTLPVPPPPVPSGPPPPPPLAPITLKFIGLIGPDNAKIAILSDGQNPPFLGKEGAIIEGRYRILKIGVESVEVAYADGRGRQTIRLTGS
jgi:hypothetical protein